MHAHHQVARFAIMSAAVLASACVPAPGAATPQHPASSSTSRYGAEVQRGLTRLRAATAPFSSLDSAVAAGYARDVARCVADPDQGGMGFHHLNRALRDGHIELERPEILLYERLDDGRYTLNGVEYVVPFTNWARDSVPPTVLSQTLKRSDVLGIWYLHVWVWKENSAGLFADWNPAVRCSGS